MTGLAPVSRPAWIAWRDVRAFAFGGRPRGHCELAWAGLPGERGVGRAFSSHQRHPHPQCRRPRADVLSEVVIAKSARHCARSRGIHPRVAPIVSMDLGTSRQPAPKRPLANGGTWPNPDGRGTLSADPRHACRERQESIIAPLRTLGRKQSRWEVVPAKSPAAKTTGCSTKQLSAQIVRDAASMGSS